MRIVILSMLLAGAIGLLGVSAISAAPINGPAIGKAASDASMVQQVRRYCYKHYTRTSRTRFLHWGHCR
jgi:hypothetical protein